MPEVVQELASAKLTRSLRIIGVRNDGYHLIESEMVSLDLADSLTIAFGDELVVVDEIAWTGEPPELSVPGDDSNLVRRALRVSGRTAAVRLVKRIPAGAGLGGGSSDAAAILRWARLWDLNLAAGIGADVAFCLRGGRALVSGIGEQVEPAADEELTLVVVTPAVSVSSAAVYRSWDDLGGPSSESGNDLEPAALLVAPTLARWRELVGEVSGVRPRLAGSGSSWFVECSTLGEAKKVEADLVDAVLRSGERALIRACITVPAVAAVDAQTRADHA